MGFKYLLIGIFCLVSGFSIVLYRFGFKEVGTKFDLIKWIFNPYIFSALFLAFLSRFSFYFFFKYYKTNVSMLVSTLSIPTTLILCYLFFGETLTIKEIIATLLIIIGVGLLI